VVIDLATCEAVPTAPGTEWLARAEQRLREADRHSSFADRPRAAELIRMGHIAFERFLAQPPEHATLPDHISQGSGAIVAATQRWRPAGGPGQADRDRTAIGTA